MRLQNSYKNYKGVIIIGNLRVKLISVLLTALFIFGTSVYAYADDSTSTADSDVSIYAENLNTFVSVDLMDDKNGSSFTITADEIKPTSALISWQSDTLYISYKICVYNIITDEYDELDATTQTSYTVKGLSPETSYDFCVMSGVSGEILGTITVKTKKKPQPKTVKMGLPSVSGSTKTYAYYTAVTVKSSPQYAVLNSGTYKGKKYNTYTDEKTGIRMVDGCYCVAMGSYYGTTMGTKYKITLSTGKSFNVILCDSKANRHTDSNNQYAVKNKDIIEFYVDKHKIPSGIRGDYGTLEQFSGSIVSIEKYV